MRLVAQRKIALDDPVSKYLPGLLPDGERITIRELLSHTSGLHDFADDTRFLAPYLRDNFGYAWTPKQMVAFAAASPLAFAPGTKFSYSNTNYIVLALLAERVGGESYEKQLVDYIFRPLKLDHTSLPASNKTLPDVHGYVGFRTRGKPDGAGNFDSAALTPAFGWSAGGIRATAKDEADFFRGLFSGKLLPAAQVAAMEDTSATGGAYGLGLMPTGGHESAWRAYTQAITTTCGRAWGHGGAFPGYYQLPQPRRLPPSCPAREHRGSAAVAGSVQTGLQRPRNRILPRRPVVARRENKPGRERGRAATFRPASLSLRGLEAKAPWQTASRVG
jgi:D-alanyl-D-alanine carboxypeptidase